MNIKSMYKEGWRVFLRLLWFGLILRILQLPFDLGIEYLVSKKIVPEDQFLFPIALYVIYAATILPFILFYSSEWTGEFIAPRTKRKQLHERRFGINKGLEPVDREVREKATDIYS
jgi:hypothetical protein